MMEQQQVVARRRQTRHKASCESEEIDGAQNVTAKANQSRGNKNDSVCDDKIKDQYENGEKWGSVNDYGRYAMKQSSPTQ